MSNPHLQVLDSTEAAEFERLVANYKTGITLIPRPYGSEAITSLHSAGGDFAKWLKASNKDIDIDLPTESQPRVLLRNNDYWLPLIWLGSSIILPVFLNLVSNYLYDKAKGALKGEKPIAHVEAVYRDRKTGVYKKFKFEGDVDQLKTVVKKFDPNEFMADDEK